MTNLVQRIREISPVLLERTPCGQPSPEIVSGPSTDPLGQPSVTALMKVHRGDIWLFAVNAAAEAVRARFRLNAEVKDGEVVWEGRKASAVDGAFEDGFEPFGVHAYRFAKGVGNESNGGS
jgi:hypothetical protein